MAHFYGEVQGSRGAASRLAGKDAGMRTIAASWQGAVSVVLYERDGIDYARVRLTTWQNGAGTERELYEGPVNGTARKSKEAA